MDATMTRERPGDREALPWSDVAALAVMAYIVFTTWTLDRFTLWMDYGITSLKLAAVAAALLLAVRWQNARFDMPRLTLPFALALGAVCSLLVYAITSAMTGPGGSASHLVGNIVLLALLLLVCQVRRGVEIVMAAVAIGAVSVAAATLIQVVVERGIPGDGATAFYGNNIQPAMYAWIGAVLLWPFLQRNDGSTRMWVAGGMGLLVTGVMLSLARGPIIVACMTGAYLFLRSRGDTVSRRDQIVAGAIALVPPLAAIGFGAWRYATQGAEGLNAFLQGRLYLLDAAWNMFVESPIFGHGFGTYREHWPEYLKHFAASPEAGNPAHSAYLSTAAELGVLGLGLCAVLLISLLVAARRQQRAFAASGMRHEARLSLGLEVGILAFATHGLLDNSGWGDRAFVVLVGLLVALDQRRRRTPSSSIGTAHRRMQRGLQKAHVAETSAR